MLRRAKSRLRIPSPGIGLGLIALVVAVSGAAYAAIPSADGVIHSCYTSSGANPSGQLRVIDAEAGAKCLKNESPLDWNARGPKGDTGATGPPGMSGYEIVSEDEEFVEDTANSTRAILISAECPTGKKAVGGGGSGRIFVNNAVTNLAQLVDSRPAEFEGTSSWQTSIGKADGSFFAVGEGIHGTAYAVCVNVAN
jgi:hypothetical protein